MPRGASSATHSPCSWCGPSLSRGPVCYDVRRPPIRGLIIVRASAWPPDLAWPGRRFAVGFLTNLRLDRRSSPGFAGLPRLPPFLSVRSGFLASYALIDLFAGCGGMTCGFEETGRFRSILAVESERDAAATWTLNFGDQVARDENGEPLRIEQVSSFPKADVVIGGPPCQGFSPLNMKGVGLERRGLWREYLRALRESEASAFVMENVPELLRSAEYASFERSARRLGYAIEARVMNAADYG